MADGRTKYWKAVAQTNFNTIRLREAQIEELVREVRTLQATIRHLKDALERRGEEIFGQEGD
jgi:hypothetical protein